MKRVQSITVILVLCLLFTYNLSPTITKVVIPAAGLGTRFLPLTKSLPKELLPLNNKPAIEYIVQEALQSGLNNISLILNDQKKALENYLASPCTLPKSHPKYHLVEPTEKLFGLANFTFILQNSPRGTGDAILKAQSAIGNEFFAVMYPDDIIFGNKPEISNLIRIAQQEHATVIAVQEVPLATISNYGVVGIKKIINNGTFEISSVVEKPNSDQAPSNLAIIGRYVFSPHIFDAINVAAKNIHSGEIPITDAIAHLIKTGHKIIAYKIQGRRFDTGTPHGWAKAIVYQALQNPTGQIDFVHFLHNEMSKSDYTL